MAELTLIYFLILALSLLLFLYLIVRPRPVKIPIKDRHVFITGGSSGIGLALAHQAASEGARVSILARSHHKLEEAKQAIQQATGASVAVFAADVRDYESVRRAVEEAGAIDVLIVNHGVFEASELESHGVEEMRFIVDVNLMGSINVIKAALPRMKGSSPASIALMSSQAGQAGVYGYAAYSATKFGLRGLAEALQQEVIAHNIHISLIFPPDTDTPGHSIDKKRRPRLTRIIASTSSAMKADEVAEKALNGIKRGDFMISCNLIGSVVSIMTAGVSPQRSFFLAFVEVLTSSILRLLALLFQWNVYRIIETCHAKKGH